MTGFLTPSVFSQVVAAAPLISIDLILRSADQQILLGERLNRPAQGFWFVPGGRVYKNEALDAAFMRITKAELGMVFNRSDAAFLGVYEHFYEDSQFGAEQTDSSTHYVVIAYCLDIASKDSISPPQDQHGQYQWWDLTSIKNSQSVHRFTKDYFEHL